MALLVLLVPRQARAQLPTTGVTVTLTNPTSLAREDANGNAVTKRLTLQPEGINLQDCRDNLQILFPLTVNGFATTESFEVWGTDQSAADCTVATARTGATQTCYPIAATFARVQTQTLPIGIKALIAGLNPTDVGSDGCRRVSNYTIKVFFLVLSGTDTAGSASASLLVSTIGPTALANVTLLPGNQSVTVEWDAVGEAGAADVIGAQAFCDPMPTPVAASDAGDTLVCTDSDGSVTTAFDASDTVGLADAGVTCGEVANEGGAAGGPIPTVDSGIPSAGSACETNAFTSGGVAVVADNDLIAKYGCGSISGATASSIRISNIAGTTLVNDQVYAVTVAGIDSFGNIGDLSPPICQYPELTTDFWSSYRNSGGEAGGGFCSVDGPGFPAGTSGLAVFGAVVILSSVRRIQRGIQRRRNGR